MSKIKIPKQLYVTAQIRNDYIWDDESKTYKEDPNGRWRQGFLHPHEPGKSGDEKRKATQHNWAYGNYFDPATNTKKTSDWEYIDGKASRIWTEHQIDPAAAPAILENVPLTGFKIDGVASRYSTSNKLFQILDPRDYVFEIPIVCLFEIMQNTTIVNGEIMSPLIWVSNKKLILAND